MAGSAWHAQRASLYLPACQLAQPRPSPLRAAADGKSDRDDATSNNDGTSVADSDVGGRSCMPSWLGMALTLYEQVLYDRKDCSLLLQAGRRGSGNEFLRAKRFKKLNRWVGLWGEEKGALGLWQASRIAQRQAGCTGLTADILQRVPGSRAHGRH